jgi:hypothetical protein
MFLTFILTFKSYLIIYFIQNIYLNMQNHKSCFNFFSDKTHDYKIFSFYLNCFLIQGAEAQVPIAL